MRRCSERVRVQISSRGAIKLRQEQTHGSTDGLTRRVLPHLRTSHSATNPASIPPYDPMACITLTSRFSKRSLSVRRVALGLNRELSFLTYSIELNLPLRTRPVALPTTRTSESSRARRQEPIHD